MAKFRKKPVAVEAEQYIEYGVLVKGMCNSKSCYASGNTEPHVHTIHDNQIVKLETGDWIIPEPDGKHYYPVRPEIFADTYEQVFTFNKIPKTLRDTQAFDKEAFKEKIANAIFFNKPTHEKVAIARGILEELDIIIP